MNKWQELTAFSDNSPMVVERVRFEKKGIRVEGQFELPPLARLSMEDQLFIIAFIQSHGSIKEMESVFGISYPTVKNRLNRIADRLAFVQIDPPSSQREVLDQLDREEISIDEAERLLSALSADEQRFDRENGRPSQGKTELPKFLRIMVEPYNSNAKSERVNIRVPLRLIRAGLKWASFIPKGAQKKVNESLKRKGIDMDFTKMSKKDLDELMENLDDFTVDVEGEERVRIFCE